NSVLEPIVDKLNKLLSKNKIQKVIKVIEELEELLDQDEYEVQSTYIFSVLAEHYNNLITEGVIQRAETFLSSENEKLRINSLIIIGFTLLTRPDILKNYFSIFIKNLLDQSEDVRDNTHYFLQELMKKQTGLVDSFKNILIKSLSIEQKKENILSLIILLESCKNLNFDQTYQLRSIIKSLIEAHYDDKKSGIIKKILQLIPQLFPTLSNRDLGSLKIDDLLALLDKQFIMLKHNFTQISKKKGITLKNYLKGFKNSKLRDYKLYFYIKTKNNLIFIYELEKDKLLTFFEEDVKISQEDIQKVFSQIIQDDSELKIFIQTLINLKITNGYYSSLGIFYPFKYIERKLEEDLKKKGIVNLTKYNYLPLQYLKTAIKNITLSTKDELLLGKENSTYYSLKEIQKKINIEAAKNSVIDLKSYRERLSEDDFIFLIKNLPKDYLSNYHKGAQWLTNLGTLRISNEVQSSKIFGFFNIIKYSKKLNIDPILLVNVFENLIDQRSGIWDRRKEIFYYSKFLTDKIEEISQISDESEKMKQIDFLANELNIDKNHIHTKIDENLQLIANEIKEKDQIKLSEYTEKTGMDLGTFFNFIDDLGITYFKKADLLIFNPVRIEEAKNEIRHLLLDKSKSVDHLNLGTFDIKSNLIEDLINDLLKDGKLKGIFYESEGEIQFFTERGIRNLMMENSLFFSFNDLFYGKELSTDELSLIGEIFDDLMNRKVLKGTFDEGSLTFSSDEVLFAKDYNIVLFEFEKKINTYLQIFESEFHKIKIILSKKDEVIVPQEINNIQDIIDKINIKYVGWRNGLEAFVRRANKKLLRDQGLSVKKYRNLFSTQRKEEIKSFAEDPEVYENLKKFESWVTLFNKLEVKYPNILFYQKRLYNNPEDKASGNKLEELLQELLLD
ncbi:MAG: hypothetical protein ACFFCI_23300, partial [Promethearchaeota archaeon]